MARPGRRPALLSPTAWLRRTALTKGVLGGQRAWMIAGGVVWGLRLARRAVAGSEETAAVETMRPGETITIRTIAPQSRRDRRSARRVG